MGATWNPTPAPTPPSGPVPWWKEKWLWIGWGIAALVAVAVFLPSKDDKPSDGGQSTAGIACERWVATALKAPSTASYGRNPSVVGLGDQTWKVHGYVDSENSFGAKIRTGYTCTGQLIGDGWHLVALDFDK